MKSVRQHLFWVIPATCLLLWPGGARAEQTECRDVVTRVKAIATGVRDTPATVNFGPSGALEPVPLLETQITVPGRGGCVIAHFSAQADPQDNHILFQVSIDDVPMEGHAQFPYLASFPTTPVVWDPEETNLNLSRMIAFNFFARVTGGVHTVRVRLASCCGGLSTPIVRAAVLTLQY